MKTNVEHRSIKLKPKQGPQITLVFPFGRDTMTVAAV